ncbi:MAG TPA: heme NO-binding domain-containing protein [Ktedonobacteraceae bacterium]
MHGLIFVTWEKYLTERFGKAMLNTYRNAIGETAASAPLVSRLYDDATLLAGVGAASQLTGLPAVALLREYGRYFIINGLTSHLCTYVLSQISSGRALLLAMRDVHARLRRTQEGLTPPLFNYEAPPHPNAIILLYDSPRQVCPVLWGAIEGAAERYGERVQIVEQSCMKREATICRFEATFSAPAWDPNRYRETPEQLARQEAQKRLADFILDFLPPSEGAPSITLTELQGILSHHKRLGSRSLRPAVLLEALQQLQFAGLVSSTANQPQGDLINRRYWRVWTFWD